MLERPLGLFRDVDLAFLQPLDQLVRREIDDLDVVRLVEERIRHSFAHADASDLRHNIVQALDMLNVERRVDVDAGGEQVFDIEVALGMAAAGRVRMGKLVDQDDLRMALEDGVEIHLLKHVPVIIDLEPRDDFEAFEQGLRFRAPMRFDNADDDVRALGQLRAGGKQHLVGFADAGSRAHEHLETAAASIFAPGLFKQRVRRRSSYGVGFGHSP